MCLLGLPVYGISQVIPARGWKNPAHLGAPPGADSQRLPWASLGRLPTHLVSPGCPWHPFAAGHESCEHSCLFGSVSPARTLLNRGAFSGTPGYLPFSKCFSAQAGLNRARSLTSQECNRQKRNPQILGGEGYGKYYEVEIIMFEISYLFYYLLMSSN